MPKLTVNGQQVTVDDSFMSLTPEQQDAEVDEIARSLRSSQAPSVFSDPVGAWKAALPANVTALVRGAGNLVNAAYDPYGTILEPARRLISPTEERRYQGGEAPGPGTKLGDAFFRWTGMPEYIPQNPQDRVKMSAAQGAVAGAPFGPLGALVGMLGGGGGQTVTELTTTPENPYGNERAATVAGLLPSLLAQGGTAAMSAARKRAQTRLTPDLYDAGVRPTIGQLMGGSLGRIEEALGSWPWIGDFMKRGRDQAKEQFNRGPQEQVLERGGAAPLSPTTPTGNASIGETGRNLGQRYDDLSTRLDTTLDPQFVMGDLGRIRARVSRLPDREQGTFADIFQNDLLRHIDPGYTLGGAGFRAAESEIGRRSAQFSGSNDPHYQELGARLGELQGALRDLQLRSNPQAAAELTRLHDAYADFKRLQAASNYLGAKEGVFSPSNLLGAAKRGDKSVDDARFAAGEARMQQYAQHGERLLGNTLPDSGTAYRSLIPLLGTSALTGYLSLPGAAGLLAAGAAARWLYSPSGRRVVTDWLMNDPNRAPPVLPGLLSEGTRLEYDQR